jgi:uncharacterized coiled-coil DUF342 family protein
MSTPIDELNRKKAECNARADQHRARRDQLNLEARQLVEKRFQIISELRERSAEAQSHRAERDSLNDAVREAKKLREEWNRKSEELSEKLQELKRAKANRPGAVPLWKLRKELKELEFRHMTTSLTHDAEKKLVAEMQRLQREIEAQERELRADPEVETTLREVEQAREEAEKHHRAVEELAQKAQKEHELMVKLFEEVDRLRREADELQARIFEVKAASDEEHRAHIAAIAEVRDLEKMLYAATREQKPGYPGTAEEPASEEDIFARFRKGAKISTEDLLAIQKGAR